MEVTPDHFVIRVPRLAGYKTLVVNAVIAAWALAIAIWPELPGADAVTPEGVGVWFDQVTGVVVGAIAILNMVLRMFATTPAAPFKRAPGADEGGDIEGYRAALEHQRREIERLRREAGIADQARTVAAALSAERIAGPDVLADSWPPLANVKADLVDAADRDEELADAYGVCAWPNCACHIQCKDRQPVNGNDLAAKLSFMHTLTSGPGARAFLAAFLLPTALLFAGLAAGCGPALHRPTPSLGCDGVQDCVERLQRQLEAR